MPIARQRLGKSATETLEMVRLAFGEHSLSRTTVFEWHSRFKAGRWAIEDDENLVRQSTTKTTENVGNVCCHVFALCTREW
jgi:hypothetical protein